VGKDLIPLKVRRTNTEKIYCLDRKIAGTGTFGNVCEAAPSHKGKAGRFAMKIMHWLAAALNCRYAKNYSTRLSSAEQLHVKWRCSRSTCGHNSILSFVRFLRTPDVVIYRYSHGNLSSWNSIYIGTCWGILMVCSKIKSVLGLCKISSMVFKK
jgi:hypothetical protein